MSPLPAPANSAAPTLRSNPFHQATFFTTVGQLQNLPATGREVAFVGRSNAGKSSAINTLVGRTRLAFVSKTPGRTQQINFFRVGESDKFLVDLPGYGFARAPGSVQQQWAQLVSHYLQSREELAGLVLIMDARHVLKELDRQLIAWMIPTGIRLHVMLTKSDKLSRQARLETLRSVAAELAKLPVPSSVQLFSSLSREGRDEAVTAIAQILDL
jgi:GTP-binding protein